MSTRTSRVPPLCRMRRPRKNDSAFVRIDGRRVYLGKWGSPESKQRYAALISVEPLDPSTDVDQSSDPTVSKLILAYLEHAQTYYRTPDGKLSREYEQQCEAMRHLRRAAGSTLAREFGPKLLQEVRQSWIAENLTRKHINGQVRRIVVMFRWAVSQELVPAGVHQALTTVKGLRKGRNQGRESKVVRPVSEADVEATLPFLPQIVGDMVRLQRLTGMRPGEVCRLRPCDLDRSGDVWLNVPPSHKTEHLDHSRTIAVGPRAQEVLLRYLARAVDACCFRPVDSEQKRRAAATRSRKTPLSCGNKPGTNRSKSPKRSPGEKYSTDSYRGAVERAARRAGVEPWTPHQLRHSAATEVRRKFGLDAAQAVLGHRNARVTEVYAEVDREKIVEVARKLG